MSAATQSILKNIWLEALLLGKKQIVTFPATEDAYWELIQMPMFRMDYGNGEITAYMSYATENHETIVANLIRLLGNAFEDMDARVLGSNRPVRIEASKKNHEPDIQVIFGETEYYHFKKSMTATKNPTILVEVLSDSTKEYDKSEKLENYKLIPTLQHIILVESNFVYVELYSRVKSANNWNTLIYNDLSLKLRLFGHNFPLSKIYNKVIFGLV